MNNWRVVQERYGFYDYTDMDKEVCKFLTEQLQSIIDHKYGLGEVWSKHYAQTIVDEASHVLLDMAQEITEQIEKDEKDDYSY
mgnify:FL=1|jgi:hypothetical protein|tara:strand:+ start:362 stop:610 length:249 start_codon:yes stop_codon:yes gene_type:complete